MQLIKGAEHIFHGGIDIFKYAVHRIVNSSISFVRMKYFSLFDQPVRLVEISTDAEAYYGAECRTNCTRMVCI